MINDRDELSNEELRFILKSILVALNHTVFMEQDSLMAAKKCADLKIALELVKLKGEIN